MKNLYHEFIKQKLKLSIQVFISILLIINNICAQTYTLTDYDVVVIDGIIQSCSYNFQQKEIIIPQYLDGQEVLGIVGVDLSVDPHPSGIFEHKELTSIQLPESVEDIGAYVFAYNNISNLKLANCKTLKNIGEGAFAENNILSIDLKDCLNLRFIGANAFSNNELEYFTLPILNESGYIWKTGLYDYSYHCGDEVNGLGTSYTAVMPYVLNDDDVEVKDGVIISVDYSSYNYPDIIIPEVLDGQTVIGIGELNANYDNAYDGVFGDCHLYLTSVQFPASIEYIGDHSFYGSKINSVNLSNHTALKEIGLSAFERNLITNVDFSNCTELVNIRDATFSFNSINNLKLNNCSKLKSIGYSAFYKNNLTNLDLSTCTNLVFIRTWAFKDNKLSQLKLSSCSKLVHIGDHTFANNNLEIVNLSECNKLAVILEGAFVDNLFSSITLPLVSSAERNFIQWWNGQNTISDGATVHNLDCVYTAHFQANYQPNDDELTIENGVIIGHSIDLSQHPDIVFPDTYNDQVIDGIGCGVFKNEAIVTVSLPKNIESIGDKAFYDCALTSLDISSRTELFYLESDVFTLCPITSLDLSNCNKLKNIGSHAFSSCLISSLDLSNCDSLNIIDSWAFSGNKISSFDFTTNRKLNTIGWHAFSYNELTNVTLSNTVYFIDKYAFDGNNLNSIGLPNPVVKEGYTFLEWQDEDNQVVSEITDFYSSYTAQFSLVSDESSPTVTLSSKESSPMNKDLFSLQIEFSEEIIDLEVSNLIVGNGVANQLSTSDNTVFTVEISPIADGEVTVDINEAVVSDLAGNMNIAAEQFSIIYDTTDPVLSFSAQENGNTNSTMFVLNIDFSEVIKGFELSDIECVNATMSNFTVLNESEYSVNISPIDDGLITVTINEGVVTDMARNSNAKAQWDIVYTGIKSLKEKGIFMFPIPAKDNFKLVSNKYFGNINVKIFSLTGACVYIEDFQSPFTENVNVVGFTSGTYLLQMQIENEIIKSKILVIH